MLTAQLIEQVLAVVSTKTVGLLGDLFLDRYLDIDPARDEPSIETGQTAYQVTAVRSYPGALGTVLNNLVALGVGQIIPIAVIGDDGEGYELQQALRRMPAVDLDGLIGAAERRTPTYTKPMYGGKELNRLDIKNRTPTPTALEDEVIRRLDAAWPRLDALIVLDQVSEEDCGVITARVRDHVATLGQRDPAKFILADSRERIGQFRNVSVKPNAKECFDAVGANPPHRISHDDVTFAVLDLLRIVGGTVFFTNGESGLTVVRPRENDTSPSRCAVPAYPVTGPIDIVGAGDSCSAGITCGMVTGFTHEQAAAFGNLVASITIQQIGTTGTATPDQVRRRWGEVQQCQRGT